VPQSVAEDSGRGVSTVRGSGSGWPVTVGRLRGESISQGRDHLQPLESSGTETLGRLFGLARWLADVARSGQSGVDRDPRAQVVLQLALLHSAKRVRGVRVEARQFVRWQCLGRVNPRGASSSSRAKPPSPSQELSRGSKPGSRCLAFRPAGSPVGDRAGLTACGFSGCGNAAATL
jgi:hypothetical protein